MKKILLTVLLLFNASLLDAMANPATMLKASAMLRRNLQMVDVDVTVEHRADGTTFIHYIRNGQEMAVFNADLLKNSGAIANMFADFGGASDEALVTAVKYLFDGLSIEQIKLAIQALDLNNQLDAIKQFVDQVDVDNLGWLANWTNKWALENVYNALISKITFNRNVAFNLYNRGLINKDVAQDVSNQIDMRNLYNFVSQKLKHIIIPSLPQGKKIYRAIYSPDGLHILIKVGKGIDSQIMIYNLNGNLIQTIVPLLEQNESINSVLYNPDGSQILITTSNSRVMIYSLNGLMIQSISPQLQQYEKIVSVVYSPDGLYILIATKRKVMIYNLSGTLIQSINPHKLEKYEDVLSAAYSPDGSHILINVRRRLLIYNLKGDLVKVITRQQLQKVWINKAVYSPDGSYILVEVGLSALMILDLMGNLIQSIIPEQGVNLAVYSADGFQILVGSDKKVRIYDLQGNLIQTMVPELVKEHEFIRSAMYSPHDTYVLAATDRKLIIYPILGHVQLDLAQKQLLLKASEAWKADKPYILSEDELTVYESLPQVLKNKKLFDVPSSGSCVIS